MTLVENFVIVISASRHLRRARRELRGSRREGRKNGRNVVDFVTNAVELFLRPSVWCSGVFRREIRSPPMRRSPLSRSPECSPLAQRKRATSDEENVSSSHILYVQKT